MSTPPADDKVREEWLRRTEAEYRSCVLTQQLTLWLLQIAAPPELIAMGLNVVRDELRHSELSANVFQAAGGRGGPELPRESLALKRRANEPLEWDVLRVALETFCLGETVAVRLFSRMHAGATVKEAKLTLARILKDEVTHREFGWTLLAWLLEGPEAEVLRALIARELPDMLERVRKGYGGKLAERMGPEGVTQLNSSFPTAARAWGLIPLQEYLVAVSETAQRDYAPRFEALEIPFCWNVEAGGSAREQNPDQEPIQTES